MALLQTENDQRILSAVTEARQEEKREAERIREELTLKINEQKCYAIENEKQKTKDVEKQVELLKTVSSSKTILL